MNESLISYLSQFEGHQAFVKMASEMAGTDLTSTISFMIYLAAVLAVVGVMATIGGLGTYAERKISADLQARQGPNRVGPFGLLQMLADGVKMILKEDIIPSNVPL